MLLTIDVPAVSFVHGLALPADANARHSSGSANGPAATRPEEE